MIHEECYSYFRHACDDYITLMRKNKGFQMFYFHSKGISDGILWLALIKNDKIHEFPELHRISSIKTDWNWQKSLWNFDQKF